MDFSIIIPALNEEQKIAMNSDEIMTIYYCIAGEVPSQSLAILLGACVSYRGLPCLSHQGLPQQ